MNNIQNSIYNAARIRYIVKEELTETTRIIYANNLTSFDVPFDINECIKWDDISGPAALMLITPEHFNKLPDGTILVSINNDLKIKGVDKIDQDTRQGYLAYGLLNKQFNKKPQKQ